MSDRLWRHDCAFIYHAHETQHASPQCTFRHERKKISTRRWHMFSRGRLSVPSKPPQFGNETCCSVPVFLCYAVDLHWRNGWFLPFYDWTVGHRRRHIVATFNRHCCAFHNELGSGEAFEFGRCSRRSVSIKTWQVGVYQEESIENDTSSYSPLLTYLF